jgi:hypothetical protein
LRCISMKRADSLAATRCVSRLRACAPAGSPGSGCLPARYLRRRGVWAGRGGRGVYVGRAGGGGGGPRQPRQRPGASCQGAASSPRQPAPSPSPPHTPERGVVAQRGHEAGHAQHHLVDLALRIQLVHVGLLACGAALLAQARGLRALGACGRPAPVRLAGGGR